MMMKLQLKHAMCAVLVSVYAPTMTNDDADKEAFCDHLYSVLRSVPFRDRLFLPGDFSARVGPMCQRGPRFSVSTLSEMRTLTAAYCCKPCSEHELAIINTYYQQANKYKSTWQHPRSKHWHMMDYVITQQCHVRDVHITRSCMAQVSGETICWSVAL